MLHAGALALAISMLIGCKSSEKPVRVRAFVTTRSSFSRDTVIAIGKVADAFPGRIKIVVDYFIDADRLELLGTLNRCTGTNLEATYEAARAGDVRDSQADIGKARELLGYAPLVNLEDGLSRTIAWCREESGRTV